MTSAKSTIASAGGIAIGSAVGQAGALIATPLIARIYTPTHVGLFASCLAVATILSAGTTLRIDRALALPKSDDDAAVFAAGGILFATLLPLLIALALALSSVSGLYSPHITWWLSVPLSIAIGVATILLQYAIRVREYRLVAHRNAIQPLVQAVGQVLLGLTLGANLAFLVAAAVVGRCAGLLGLIGRVLRPVANADTKMVSLRFWSLVKRYQRILYLGTLSGIVNTAGLQAAVPLVAFAFGAHSAGLFSMAQMLFVFPVIMLGNSIGQVFLGEFSHAVRRSSPQSSTLFRRSSTLLALLGCTLGGMVAVAAPYIVHLLLGRNWTETGLLGVLLVPLIATRLMAAPLAQTLIVLERQGTQLAIDVVKVSGTVAVILVSGDRDFNLSTAILAYSIWGGSAYLVQWYASWRAVTELGRRQHSFD